MKKKITFVINSIEGGGTEKHLLQLVKYLKKKYQICIFSFKSGRLKKFFIEQDIEVKFPETHNNNVIFFLKFLFNTNTDLYHFFLPKAYIIGGLLTFFSSKKKIMSRRSLNNYHKKYFNISLYVERLLHKKMNLILTNSIFVKKQLIEKEDVEENKIVVIKNFFSFPRKKLSLKKKLGLGNSEKIFASVANLIPYKNHIHLIKACSKIKLRNWKLLFIGEDRNHYKLQLEKEIKKYDLRKNIIFTGYLDDIEMYLDDLEFIVNVSNEEGSSNSLLQGLAAGVPILASNIDTNREFVEHNKNGFLFKKGNVKDLIKYLEIFLESKDTKTMRIKSKQIFNKRFNLKASIDGYFDVYKKLID